MKINFFQKKMLSNIILEMPLAPLLILILFFSNNIFSVLKSILLGFILLFIARRNLLKYFDINFILISIFFLIYALMSSLDSEIKTEFIPALLFMPAILYVAGKWLAYNSKHSAALVMSFLLIGLSLASMAVLGLWDNFTQFGFESGSRNIAIGQDGDEINATVIGGTLIILVSFGGLIFSKNAKMRSIERILILLLFILSMLAAIRLGSRTLLGLGGIILLFGFIYNIRKKLLSM
ncbi:MAG: hypothetical protein IPQ12_11035 [Polaromonas sp.]|nr:hypothetical protein [Polaromonas sp.]